MRTFYIYNINDIYKDTYLRYPYQLYKILEDIYLTKSYNLILSTNYYGQIINKYNKLYINNYISANYRLDMCYNYDNNIHTISKSREYSVLMVSSYCLKLKSNNNYPNFLDVINNISDNIFICDFENNDYFWLKKIIKKKELII